jgi:hypothetical protein
MNKSTTLTNNILEVTIQTLGRYSRAKTKSIISRKFKLADDTVCEYIEEAEKQVRAYWTARIDNLAQDLSHRLETICDDKNTNNSDKVRAMTAIARILIPQTSTIVVHNQADQTNLSADELHTIIEEDNEA